MTKLKTLMKVAFAGLLLTASLGLTPSNTASLTSGNSRSEVWSIDQSVFEAIAPMTSKGADGVERADAHALWVRAVN